MRALDNEQKEETGSPKCSSYPAKSILLQDDFRHFLATTAWEDWFGCRKYHHQGIGYLISTCIPSVLYDTLVKTT